MNSCDIKIEEDILWIKNGSGDIFWDTSAFRPSLEKTLKLNKLYKAKIQFETRNISVCPKIIQVGDILFVNIR